MKKCKACGVQVLDHTATCPLCNRILVEEGEKTEGTKMYPDVQFDQKIFRGIERSFCFLMGLVAVICVIVNLLTYTDFLWSIIVVVAICYLITTVSYSVAHHANPAAKIVVETIGAGILVSVIDHVVGYQGWSVDYAIPGLILVADFAIVVLMIVNRMNWYSYILYQGFIAVLSVVPIILYLIGIVEHPVVGILASVVSLVIILASVTFGDRNGKNELMRRFHT